MAQDTGGTLIDVDTSIDGKIQGKDATIAGKFKGEVHLSGLLTVLPSANVEATIQADQVEVSGTFSGKITSRKVVLLETAKVNGNIDAVQLVVKEGAMLNGPVASGKSATPKSGGPPSPAPPAPAAKP
jgi:cytoskeletal protein CcmA (bactofilin family)